MTDYTELDTAIVEKIAGGAKTFYEIDSGPVSAMANTMVPVRLMSFRLIDRRLQALRKAGKLAYERKTGWMVLKGTQ